MATTGTTSFLPDFTEIAEEAWERAGREMRSAHDLETARRSMNLLTIEWQNRGINMWTITPGSVALVAGTATYNLPTDTVDLMEHVVRTNDGASGQSDLVINRISMPDYASIPNKLTTGRPISILINRNLTTPTFTLWPVPDGGTTYTLYYWRMRRIEDAGNGVETPDVPFRFYPALMSGLAYYIAMKVPDLASRVQMLKEDYTEQFGLAAAEDREKATFRIVPRMY